MIFRIFLITMIVGTWTTTARAETPGWLQAEWERLTTGDGRWIASNAAFESADEPYSHYGIEWHWAIGQQGLTGRLYGLQYGEEAGDFWHYRVYWDPAAGEAVIEQFDGAGTVGRGSMRGFGAGILSEQRLVAPDGSERLSLHHSWFEDDIHHTESYRWEDGAWVAQRRYQWRRDEG